MEKQEFTLPEYDELTHQRILPKAELRHDEYYIGRCRNACIARWNSVEDCFYHWREKLGRTYIETIRYPSDDDIYDVFRVLEELKNPRFEIPYDLDATFTGNPADLNEYNERVWCTCGAGSMPCIPHRLQEQGPAKRE
jgi:hypothetical protein